jgi:FkbM family methyltransferase
MEKFSQYDEQRFITEAFEGKPLGRFLDAGSHDGVTFSCTRALYLSGWSGVLIEPSPTPVLKLLELYGGEDSRATIVQAAVAVNGDLIKMHITDDLVSTSDEKCFEQWRKEAKFIGSMIVPVITLELITLRFGHFDMVNLDTEGTSADLFLRAMELQWRPHCFCVEHDGRLPEILQAASAAGYKATYGNGTNVVLVR